jgi:hypothetical protein
MKVIKKYIIMNKWTKLSIEYANQRSYLDDLFQVYPTIPDGIRDVNDEIWGGVETAYKHKNNDLLIRELTEIYSKYNIMSALVLRNYLDNI